MGWGEFMNKDMSGNGGGGRGSLNWKEGRGSPGL